MMLQVVEQTEFIDDASFQVFRGSGKQESYTRRAANTRLMSAEKLTYICKNQLGVWGEARQGSLKASQVQYKLLISLAFPVWV